MKISFLTISNRPVFHTWCQASVAGQGLRGVEIEHVLIECEDGNLGGARRCAQEAATGDFCAWHDDDDLWLHGRLARMLAVVDRDQSVDIVHDPINPDIRVDLLTGLFREHHYGCPIIHRDLLWRRAGQELMDQTLTRFEDVAWQSALMQRRDMTWHQLPYRHTPLRISLEHSRNVSEKRAPDLEHVAPFPFVGETARLFSDLQAKVYPCARK